MDYCLLDIWIDNKSFGQLGELTSILFKDFGLSIGLSRDPRKNWGGRSLFSRGHSLLLIFCYQTHSLTVEEIKFWGAKDNVAPPLYPTYFSLFFHDSFISTFEVVKYNVNQRKHILYSEERRQEVIQTRCFSLENLDSWL